MAFYGRQQTTTNQTANQPKVSGPATCLKTCEKVMNQCLVDATTFMEKERCRDRYDICSGKCGTAEESMAFSAQGRDGRRPDPEPEPIPKPEPKPIPGPGPSPEPGPNDCMAACRADRRECYRENRGRGESTDICDRYFAVCQKKCGGELPTKCYEGATCSDSSDCGGKPCVNGKCQCTAPPKVCVEGATCKDSTQCQPDGSCINEKCHCTGGGCQDDAYCIKKHGAGWYCYKTAGSARGICKQKGAGDCVPGKRCTGPKRPNSQCGGLTCFRPKSWDEKDESVPGTCYCNTGPGPNEGGGGGEFKWSDELSGLYGKLMGKAGDYLDVDLPDYNLPPELQALLDQLLGRAGEYMARKPGYSQSALDARFGKGYENIRNLANLARGQTTSALQREGMLGTGAGQAALRQIPWQTEKNVSDTIRDVFLGNEDQKRKDLEAFTNIASGLFGQGVGVEQMVEAINAERRGEERDYTGIANQLFGTGMTYEQLLESLNAARRGEGQNALALYLQYVMSLMSSWKG